MLQQANRQFRRRVDGREPEVLVETGAFLQTADEVGAVVVGVHAGRPVYLREVAEIVDGAEEPANYVFFGQGAGHGPTRTRRRRRRDAGSG
jgi:multidrug efflux pump subunit AcrB